MHNANSTEDTWTRDALFYNICMGRPLLTTCHWVIGFSDQKPMALNCVCQVTPDKGQESDVATSQRPHCQSRRGSSHLIFSVVPMVPLSGSHQLRVVRVAAFPELALLAQDAPPAVWGGYAGSDGLTICTEPAIMSA